MQKPYCPHCKIFIADESVIFDNRHSECGIGVEWIAQEERNECKVIDIKTLSKRQENELIQHILKNTKSF